MAGVRVEINDAEVLQALNQMLARGDDVSPALQEFGGFIESEVQEQFQDSTDPYGFPWIPSLRALGLDDADAGTGKTLVDQGHLRDSFHPAISFDGNTLIFGSNMIYAAIHQFGGEAGKDHSVELPARPILPYDGWPTNWEEEMVTILGRHLMD